MSGQPEPRELLAARGLRATRHRVAILEAIARAAMPLDATAVHAALRGKLALATVYRVLATLEGAGIIQRQPHVTGGPAHFHMAQAAKGQVVCSRCGKVEEFEPTPAMRRLSEEVSRQSEFAAASQSLYIIADCRKGDVGRCD